MVDVLRDRWEVELRIAVAEGVLSRAEADTLGEEARRKEQSPLALLVERGRLSEGSFQSILAEAMNDPMWRAAGRDALASTYTMPIPPPSGAGDPPFPVAGWDRYTPVRFLGQGGMGVVFLAIDTRLRREVAIKFVRGDSAEHVRRLISEARTQARVSHERICKVYEVDEVEGKVYIAMQYIAGKPLGHIADELTLEQKVTLVRRAAEGIHAAHSEGIIHRDIKPSNIMVERSDDGELRPYVMDFGLARSVQDAGETVSGAVVGTPRYMSPEQARGATSKLDRRADVYSLGATLYHLVTGEPVVPGETVAEVIHNLIAGEPRPLRAHDPAIPIDLEAIVLKCLERDRAARYDSARALADDLGRFLNGEPVVARSAGTWYRLRKRLAKQRRLVAAAAAAFVALGVAIGWAISTRVEAGERERFAQQFTEAVENIESTARYSALAPLHDVRSDRKAIRARMAEIEAEIARGGEVAAGPGHYALGRGYLALDDDARARDELESAWNRGFREPRVAYALAQAIGHLYRRSLAAAALTAGPVSRPLAKQDGAKKPEPLSDVEALAAVQRDAEQEMEKLREARQREVDRQYRGAILAYLAASNGAEVRSTEYFAALDAYYEGHFEEALHHLDAIGSGLPWFYEASELRGDTLFARALTFRKQGEKERARNDFEAGRKAYAAAAGIARSVPAVYESLAELERAAMAMELYGQGDVVPPYERALAATAQALAADPDDYGALVLKASVQLELAEYQHNQGAAVEDLLAKAIGDAERAARVFPARSQARQELAEIYRLWEDDRLAHNQDPSEQFHKAVDIARSISPEDQDAPYHNNLGLMFEVWADYQDRTGVDSSASREQAIAAFTRALQINNKMAPAWIDLGLNSFKQASNPRARDPEGDIRRALEAFNTARSVDSHSWVPCFYLGKIYALRAQREAARGADPDPDLALAMKAYRDGLTIGPKFPYLHNGVGAVLLDQAQAAWDRGGNPEPSLVEARQAFEHAISVAPGQEYAYGNLGEVHARRAWFQRASGEDPSESVAAAVAALKDATTRFPNSAQAWIDLAMAHAIQAAYNLEHGRQPEPSLGLAAGAIKRARELDPTSAQSWLYLGEVRGLQARRSSRKAEFTEAEQAFQKAIELEPEQVDARIALGQFYRAWAALQQVAGHDPLPVLDLGLARAGEVLARRRDLPDALVLRAGLTLLKAQISTGADRAKLAASARDDFTRAVATNHALGKAWDSDVALAQRMATVP